MKWMLFLVFTILQIPTTAWAGEDCGHRTAEDGTVFTLQIERSFHAPVRFELCERKPPQQSFLLVHTKQGKAGVLAEPRKLDMDKATYARIYRLYDQSLVFDLRDASMGLDGSTWCLETTRGFTYSKSCFWTPADNAKRRRLEGLIALGEALWRFARLKEEVGGLD